MLKIHKFENFIEQEISKEKREKEKLEVEIMILHEMLVCKQLDIDKVGKILMGNIDETSLNEINPDM